VRLIGSGVGLVKMCTPSLDLFDEVSSTLNGDHMQKLRPWEVDVSTTLNEPANLLEFHLLG